MEVTHYWVKTAPTPMIGTKEDIQAGIPNSKFLFNYRNLDKCMRSVVSLASALPFSSFLLGPDKIFPYYTRKLFITWFLSNGTNQLTPAQIDLITKEFINTENLPLMQAFVIQITIIHHYIHHYKDCSDIPGVKNEHLLANPRRNLEIIFDYCGLSKDLVDLGMRGFDEDSQKNSIISKKNVSKSGNRHQGTIDAKFREQMNRIADALKVSILDDDHLLPNTMTS
jgi:hypothetical protein